VPAGSPTGRAPTRRALGRIAVLLILLYGFLLAIGLMESAFRGFGASQAGGLFEGVSNPFVALMVGVLATVLVQSSSVTTSTIVALVASGQLSLVLAVPMVMGANIGTSMTSTLVSLGSVRNSLGFRRAFACATVHDAFNVLSVLVLLPLELATGWLHLSAERLAGLAHGVGGGTASASPWSSPINVAVRSSVSLLDGLLAAIGAPQPWLALVTLALALGLIFFSLLRIMSVMRSLLAERIEASLNRMLGRSGLLGLLAGAGMTFAVQSSSITTSMLVPMAGAGILSLRNAYPIVLGCNIGTTATALIASLATDSESALAIALVHLLFNAGGTLLFYAVPGLRTLPPRLSEGLAELATRNKAWIVIYLAFLFIVLPLAGILLFH
jgi:sodium-dependent phosphate cotransporter